MRYVALYSKPLPIVEPGDVVKWYQDDGINPLDVQFSGASGSPCKPGGTKNECEVVALGGLYAYSCITVTCTDPVVPVGNSKLDGVKAQTVTAGFNNPVGIACDSQNKAIVDPQTASHADSFQWGPVGGNPVSAWSFDLPNICDQSSHFDQNARSCTVSKDAVPNTYNYQVTVPACTAQPTYTATITIQ
jgi:hypothetical protein